MMKLKPAHPDAALEDATAALDLVLSSATTPVAKPTPLPLRRLAEPDQVARTFRAAVEAGTSWERVLQPSYWQAASSKLRAGDLIEAVPDDLSFYGRCLVVQAYGQNIKVAPIEYVEITSVGPVDLTVRSGFEIQDRGLTDKFTIVRTIDGQVMQRGIDTHALASEIIFRELVPRASKRGFS